MAILTKTIYHWASIGRWCVALLVSAASAAAAAGEPWEGAGAGELFMRANQQPWQPSVHLQSLAEISISGLVVDVEYRQSFKNISDQWQEAVYVFPLGEQAAVYGLRMTIGEREIVGEVKEKAEAQQIYQQAQREGKKAALLDQQRPNLFTQRIANIAPGETVSITLNYTEAARFDNGQFSWRLPTTLTPRYKPRATSGSSEPAMGSGEAEEGTAPPTAHAVPPMTTAADANTMTIAVDLAAGMPVADITALYHDVETVRSGNRYSLTLSDGPADMDRDFVLQWRPVSSSAPTAAIFKEVVGTDEYMMLMVLPPAAEEVAVLPRDVVFVLDTSGSMAGSSIVQARAALGRAIEQLGDSDRFNVVEFNSDHRLLFKQLRHATASARAEAIAWVEQLAAGGGTEMLPALNAALNEVASSSTALKQIVFITDGAVANEAALFKLIQQQLGDSRLFTVGIGSAPNSYFMRKAAQFGRGTFTYISHGSEVAGSMDLLFRKLSSAAASNVQLAWPAAVEQFPPRVPDLYRGEPLVVYAKAPTVGGELTISGDLTAPTKAAPLQAWQQSLGLTALTPAEDHSGIARLWARHKVEALEDQKVAGRDAAAVRDEVLALALTHQLVTAYTSFVAVEQEIVRPPSASSESSAVANRVAKGQLLTTLNSHAIAFPATATSLSLSLYVGFLAMLMLALLLGINCARVRESDYERL